MISALYIELSYQFTLISNKFSLLNTVSQKNWTRKLGDNSVES